MKYIFIQDHDCHWYMIPQEFRTDFYVYVDNMEDDKYSESDINFDFYRINNPSDYCFENPRNCFTND